MHSQAPSGLWVCLSDVLFFSETYLGFSFPRPCHEHSEPHKAFYCAQSEEGQIKLMETRLNLCPVPFYPLTVTEDGLLYYR